MDYYLMIASVCILIEKHLKSDLSYRDLENRIGFSYRHIREIFKEQTNMSLARYVLKRRIANAAFEMIHSDRALTDIAMDFGFEQYGSFIRAFKRETGFTPSSFRQNRCRVGRRILTIGIYAPAILTDNVRSTKIDLTEVNNMTDNMRKSDGSCILLGVPKVEYKEDSATPFPACLKACLNYMGQDIDYAYIMAASGAAFRLRWHTGFWDGGNVDIMNIYENGLEAFERSFQAAGRKHRFLMRENSGKEGFITFIRNEIDAGRPVIATGIIGPPETCIITGYKQNGESMLGWNFFQDRSEYAKGVTFDENGYFITDGWWENESTRLLISIGEAEGPPALDRDILQNALAILTKEEIRFPGSTGVVTGAQAAFDRLAEKISDDGEFSKDMIMPLLIERLMCLNDAQCMIGEGRYYAARYLETVGVRHPDVQEKCKSAAELFLKASAAAYHKINTIIGDFCEYESRAKQLLKPDIRRAIAEQILAAKKFEASAREIIADILIKLQHT
ncbi:MAG: helix-turn-helix domain-containing protein [Clostridiales bacterium]|nr:helix-turn-helix domain-containing protein [Clostridiales bacterium]